MLMPISIQPGLQRGRGRRRRRGRGRGRGRLFYMAGIDIAGGAYILCVRLAKPLTLNIGSLGKVRFPAGRYAYVGSAKNGVAARVARHSRLAHEKAGKIHWHIDRLLTHPQARWLDAILVENGVECALSQRIASMPGVTAPVPGFGASDCRAGCSAHLYLLPHTFPAHFGCDSWRSLRLGG